MAVWQVSPSDEWMIDHVGDFDAVYHFMSGQTHVLAPGTAEILDALKEAPLTTEDLFGRLLAEFDFAHAAGEEPVDILSGRLKELDNLGLIHRVMR